MTKSEIREMRMQLGKSLHEFFLKYGEKEYEKYINNLAKETSCYGDIFSDANLRIMEAEYLTLSAELGVKNKPKDQKTSNNK